ncbi:MAG: hypothetical protein EA387_03460 [Nitriliruptor sp.]|nr:MAG: hypothetical protein EA387_03460 [Nitriliruptor sp.]
MEPLADDERRAFLAAGARTVALATVRADDASLPFALVVEGRCTISEDPEERRRWDRTIAAGYVPERRAGESGARNAVEGELLVRLVPSRITARRGVTD